MTKLYTSAKPIVLFSFFLFIALLTHSEETSAFRRGGFPGIGGNSGVSCTFKAYDNVCWSTLNPSLRCNSGPAPSCNPFQPVSQYPWWSWGQQGYPWENRGPWTPWYDYGFNPYGHY